jgi:GT2 family glycosyltransferase
VAERAITPASSLYTAGSSRAEAANLSPRVTCVILNWNGWRDTVACLNALKDCDYDALTIVVVDNGSTDDSVSKIRAAHPDVLLIESSRNLGFAGGNNIGIRYALANGADYIWLLNNDTKPDGHALSALVKKALTDPHIGAVASVCFYASEPSRVEAWGGARVNLWIGYGRNSRQPRRDQWFDSLNGTSLLISRDAIEHVGALDEKFFLYWEDTEFCLRLRKQGWRLAAASDSHVLHKVNASTGGNKVVLDRYQTASGLRLLSLHSRMPLVAMFLFLTIRFARRILRFQWQRCKSVWAGVEDYRRSLPERENDEPEATFL